MTAASPLAVEGRVPAADDNMTDAGDASDVLDAIATTTEPTFPEATVNAVTPSKKRQDETEVFSPALLKMYYARLFPYSLLCKWLSYDSSFDTKNTNSKPVINDRKKVFSRREFSFTLEPMPGEEIYIRYQSFSDLEGLRSAINRRQPRKIDIGAVFSHPPKDKNAYGGGTNSSKNTGFRPVQRELVFDIDLTDYDDVRRCGCSGAQICSTCWTFMAAALKVLNQGLREDFGFEHIAWFYSGRRGIHAWVCDEEARNLSDEARSAVANYFEISLNKKNSEGLLGSANSGSVHPMLTRSYDALEPYFCRYVLPGKDDNGNGEDDDDSHKSAIGGHGLLATRDAWEELVLDALPFKAKETVGKNLKKKWANLREADELTPVEKWQTLLQHLRVRFGFPSSWPSPSSSNDSSDETSKKRKKSRNNFSTSTLDDETLKIYMWPMEFVFKYVYPRLDINVSKMQNHLLKSPFCVHPKTGRVCVPIDPETMDAHHPSGGFDPFSVPTLAQLARELDEYHKHENDANEDSNQKTSDIEHDWQKTSLKSYFNVFEENFLEPIEKEWRRQDRDLAEQQAATRGDF